MKYERMLEIADQCRRMGPHAINDLLHELAEGIAEGIKESNTNPEDIQCVACSIGGTLAKMGKKGGSSVMYVDPSSPSVLSGWMALVKAIDSVSKNDPSHPFNKRFDYEMMDAWKAKQRERDIASFKGDSHKISLYELGEIVERLSKDIDKAPDKIDECFFFSGSVDSYGRRNEVIASVRAATAGAMSQIDELCVRHNIQLKQPKLGE